MTIRKVIKKSTRVLSIHIVKGRGPRLKSVKSYFIKWGPRLKNINSHSNGGPRLNVNLYFIKGGPRLKNIKSYFIKRGPRLKTINLYSKRGAITLKSSIHIVKGAHALMSTYTS